MFKVCGKFSRARSRTSEEQVRWFLWSSSFLARAVTRSTGVSTESSEYLLEENRSERESPLKDPRRYIQSKKEKKKRKKRERKEKEKETQSAMKKKKKKKKKISL